MLNEDIAADLRQKAERGEPGFEDHPNFRSAYWDYDKVAFTTGLNDFKRAVHQCAVDHGWWEDSKTRKPIERNMGEMLMLMTSELAEALEAYREGDIITQIRYEYPNGDGTNVVLYEPAFVNAQGEQELGKPVGVASEFADTIIRILDTCEKLNIPVTEALVRKHNYNITRPYRHGGKLA